MKNLLFIIVVMLFSHASSAVEFTGAALTEEEIYALWGNDKCKPFMVNSSSSKSAMPTILANYLNANPSYQEVKIITCKYKSVRIQHFLAQTNSVWSMFNGEAVVLLPKIEQ